MEKKIKSILIKIIPKWIFKLRSGSTNHALFAYDKRRFNTYYSSTLKNIKQNQLNARLTFHAHSIEKGLSHDQIRYGFGITALNALAKALKAYDIHNFNKSDIAYTNALSVLKAYIAVHTQANYDLDYLSDIFGDLLDAAKSCDSNIGGATVITKESKLKNKTKNFEKLFSERFSVRTYSDEPVSVDAVKAAVELSMKAPSVCNRQPTRVYIIKEQTAIKDALNIQKGMLGYSTPPILLAVTSDIGSYVSLTERNQVFVDGGAFSMALLLGLENEGLAACPLNAMLDVSQDRKMRKVLSIHPNENIIMFIAVGNFQNENNVPKSFRFRADSITTVIDSH